MDKMLTDLIYDCLCEAQHLEDVPRFMDIHILLCMQRRVLSVLWQRVSLILEEILPIFSRCMSVGLPGQSRGIFNQHSEAIPSAADKGANVLV